MFISPLHWPDTTHAPQTQPVHTRTYRFLRPAPHNANTFPSSAQRPDYETTHDLCSAPWHLAQTEHICTTLAPSLSVSPSFSLTRRLSDYAFRWSINQHKLPKTEWKSKGRKMLPDASKLKRFRFLVSWVNLIKPVKNFPRSYFK